MDVFGLEDVPQLLEKDNLEKVHKSFKKQLEQIKENSSNYRSSEDIRIGFEVEYTLLDEDNETASRQVRNKLKNKSEFFDSELAASMLEIKTNPIQPNNVKDLEEELLDKERLAVEEAEKEDLSLLRHGTDPFTDVENFERSGESGSRYEVFAEFLDDQRNDEEVIESFGLEESFDPRDIHYSGMIASTQSNLQAKSLEDAVEKANFAYSFLPYAVALGGNSRIIEGKDTGFSDIRVPLWEKSADFRSSEDYGEESPRAGKLESYYDSIDDYFERLDPIYVAPDPDSALDQAVANNWKDVNIKFDREDKNALVELRPLSIQPSAREDLALSMFMTGRIAYAQVNGESPMDIEKVNRNRYSAMHNGMDTPLYSSSSESLEDSTDVLNEELDYARKGLEILEIEYDLEEDEGDLFDAVLSDRFEDGLTPGDRIAEDYKCLREDLDDSDALARVMKNYKI